MSFARLVSINCLLVVSGSVAATAGTSALAKRCRVNLDQPPARIFAEVDGKSGWREYHRVGDVPALDLDGGESALLWVANDGHMFIKTEQPGQDFIAFTDYCFDKAGELTELNFELRTAWGWGYRQERPIAKGAIVPRLSEFFDTETGKVVPKPEQANSVPDALKPQIYLHVSNMPFSRLLPP